MVEHDIPGVYKQREFRRFYPQGEVMAHVLGFTNIDDRGQEGMELAFDDWLRRQARRARSVIRDRRGRIVENVDLIRAARAGQGPHAVSIDRRIQYLAYRELKARAAAKPAPASGSVVVLDVADRRNAGDGRTSRPTTPTRATRAEPRRAPQPRRDRPDGARLDDEAVHRRRGAGGRRRSRRTIVHTSPGWMHERQIPHHATCTTTACSTLTGVLTKSSNIGAAQDRAWSMTSEHFYDFVRRFGYGESTHSGFPGESSGVLPAPRALERHQQARPCPTAMACR